MMLRANFCAQLVQNPDAVMKSFKFVRLVQQHINKRRWKNKYRKGLFSMKEQIKETREDEKHLMSNSQTDVKLCDA